MNGLMQSWYFRAGLVAVGTWAVIRYAPLPPVGKTAAIAIGAVAVAGIVGSNVPLVRSLLAGALPAPVAAG